MSVYTTKLDLERGIAKHLLVVIENLTIIKEAHAETIDKLQLIECAGVKTRVKDFRQVTGALGIVLLKCDEVLSFTRKKRDVKYTSQSNEAVSNEVMRHNELVLRSKGLQVNACKNAIDKMKTSVIDPSPPARVVSPSKPDSGDIRPTRIAHIIVKPNAPVIFPRKEVQGDKVLIHCSPNIRHLLDPPKIHGTVYTHAEMIIMIDDMQTEHGMIGWKALIEALNKLHMLKLE